MPKPKRPTKPVHKTPKGMSGQTEHIWGYLHRRRQELEQAPLEVVLLELGQLVTNYTVWTGPTYDGVPDLLPDGGMVMPPVAGWEYRVAFDIHRPGRPGFGCYGVWRDTLQAAAVESLLAGLGWTGAARRTVADTAA